MRYSVVERAVAYVYAQDGFRGEAAAIEAHRENGEYGSMFISVVKAGGWLAVEGWRAPALMRSYNREKLDIAATDFSELGKIRAIAEAIIAGERLQSSEHEHL